MVVCSVDAGVDSALLSDLEIAVAAGENMLFVPDYIIKCTISSQKYTYHNLIGCLSASKAQV